jgi:hypothetical protein
MLVNDNIRHNRKNSLFLNIFEKRIYKVKWKANNNNKSTNLDVLKE